MRWAFTFLGAKYKGRKVLYYAKFMKSHTDQRNAAYYGLLLVASFDTITTSCLIIYINISIARYQEQ